MQLTVASALGLLVSASIGQAAVLPMTPPASPAKRAALGIRDSPEKHQRQTMMPADEEIFGGRRIIARGLRARDDSSSTVDIMSSSTVDLTSSSTTMSTLSSTSTETPADDSTTSLMSSGATALASHHHTRPHRHHHGGSSITSSAPSSSHHTHSSMSSSGLSSSHHTHSGLSSSALSSSHHTHSGVSSSILSSSHHTHHPSHSASSVVKHHSDTVVSTSTSTGSTSQSVASLGGATAVATHSKSADKTKTMTKTKTKAHTKTKTKVKHHTHPTTSSTSKVETTTASSTSTSAEPTTTTATSSSSNVKTKTKVDKKPKTKTKTKYSTRTKVKTRTHTKTKTKHAHQHRATHTASHTSSSVSSSAPSSTPSTVAIAGGSVAFSGGDGEEAADPKPITIEAPIPQTTVTETSGSLSAVALYGEAQKGYLYASWLNALNETEGEYVSLMPKPRSLGKEGAMVSEKWALALNDKPSTFFMTPIVAKASVPVYAQSARALLEVSVPVNKTANTMACAGFGDAPNERSFVGVRPCHSSPLVDFLLTQDIINNSSMRLSTDFGFVLQADKKGQLIVSSADQALPSNSTVDLQLSFTTVGNLTSTSPWADSSTSESTSTRAE